MALTSETPGDEEVVTAELRPNRRARTEQAILAATRELLVEGGVHGLTVEGVAARAGVAKTTIYRRYRSKDELALAVLIDMVEHVASIPDLGDTRAELVMFVNRAVKILGSTLMGRVMQGLVSDLATDRELARAFQERVVAVRVAEMQRIIDRGIARGDIRPDGDYQLANELFFGPVYYRLLLSGRPLSRNLAGRIVDAILPAFAVTTGGTSSMPRASSVRAPARARASRGRPGRRT
jgi:AcrR family transcriptional regulator